MSGRRRRWPDETDNFEHRSRRRRSIGEWLADEMDDPPRRNVRRYDDDERRFDMLASAIGMLEDRLEDLSEEEPLQRRRPVVDSHFDDDAQAAPQAASEPQSPLQHLQGHISNLHHAIEAARRGQKRNTPLNQEFASSLGQQAYTTPTNLPAAQTNAAGIEGLRRDVQVLRNAVRQSSDQRAMQGLEAEFRSLTRRLGENNLNITGRELQDIKGRIDTLGRAVLDSGFSPNNRYLYAQLQELKEGLARVQRPVLPDKLVDNIRDSLSEATRKLVPISIQDARTLEKNIQLLSERLEHVRAQHPDNIRLRALEEHIGKLSRQLSETERLLPNLQSIERMLGSIAMHGNGTSLATLDSKSAGVLRGFQKQIDDVRAASDASDKRMHQALAAIQDVAARISDRPVTTTAKQATKTPGQFGQREEQAEPKTPIEAAREAAARAAQLTENKESAEEQPTRPTTVRAAQSAATAAARELQNAFGKATARALPRRPLPSEPIEIPLRAEERPTATYEDFDEMPDNVTPFRRAKRYISQLGLAAAGVAILIGAYNLIGPLLSGDQAATASSATASITQAVEEARHMAAQASQDARPEAAPAEQRMAAIDPPALPQHAAITLPPFPEGLSNGRLKSSAMSGDPRALFEIGTRLADGRSGLAVDPAQAATWLKLAAERSHAPALYRLGTMYEKGRGVTRDLQEATKLYTVAANLGNRRALHNLATLYASGVGGHPDFEKAFPLFERAAELGLVDSQYNVAVLYVNGMGVKASLTEAYKWFAIAAQNGDTESAKKRDEIGARFDGKTLVAARLAAQSFKPKAIDPAANEEVISASVWEDHPSATDISALPAKPGDSTVLGSGLSINLPQTSL